MENWQKNKNKIRLSFDVSPEAYNLIEKLAKETGGTKSEVFRKAIALIDVALDAKRRGLKLGLADKEDALKTEIIGI